MTGEAPFQVLGFRELPRKHDGTFPKNRWRVSVEVEGEVHEVLIRSNEAHAVARLPTELRGHPSAQQIKDASLRTVTNYLLEQIYERRPDLRDR